MYAYTSSQQSLYVELQPAPAGGYTGPWSRIMYVDVPAGRYLINVNEQLEDTADLFGQDNSRLVDCQINWGLTNGFTMTLQGRTKGLMTPSAVGYLSSPGRIAVDCRVEGGGSDRSYVTADYGTISALKVGALN